MAKTSGSESAAERLWQRFGEMFGSRFYESFGEKPSEMWIDAVKELRNDQIRGALRRILNAGAAHPPSLPEFIALASNVQPPPPPPAPSKYDKYHAWGQRALFAYMQLRASPIFAGPDPEWRGVTPDELKRLVEVKNRFVEEMRAANVEGDVREWRETMFAAFQKISPAEQPQQKAA